MNIPYEVIESLKSEGYSTTEINEMTPRELMTNYCRAEGLLNYSEVLWMLVESMADKVSVKFRKSNSRQPIKVKR